MDGQAQTHTHLGTLVEIVAAYVRKNKVSAGELFDLILSVGKSLRGFDVHACVHDKLQHDVPFPAVPASKSVFHDYLICLEDGRKVVLLNRYIKKFCMTPKEYRAKWGLPVGYPMEAPAYSETRTRLAKQTGLGHRRKTEQRVPSGTSAGRPRKI